MATKNNTKNNPSNSTQRYLDIDSIKDSVVILKDGGMRAVLMASSINFDLKANDEQDAIIYAYQNFLNALDFPIQIFISSRELDLHNYLQYLAEIQKTQTNELLSLQTLEYINFIKDLITEANIVSKTFYIVIPFAPIEGKQDGFFSKIKAAANPKATIKYNTDEFLKYKTQLWQRVNSIMYGLRRSGIYMTPLNTQELIELYFSLYNPDSKLSDSFQSLDQLDINS